MPEQTQQPIGQGFDFIARLVFATLVGGLAVAGAYRWINDLLFARVNTIESVIGVVATLALIGCVWLILRTLQRG